MNRATVIFVLLATACGGEDAPTVPTGTYRLVGEVLGGATTATDRLHGALQVTTDRVALAVATSQMTAALGAYTQEDGDLNVTGGPSYAITREGTRVILAQGAQNRWTFEPFTPAASNVLDVTGRVTLGSGQAALVQPRVAMIFVSRDMPYVNSPRDDMALTFDGGSATFDLSRTDGPLGIEVIEWDSRTVVTSIGFIVVYEDRNGSNNLDELAACTSTTVDCIRAISPVYIAYRNGSAPNLAASQYAELRSGWTHAIAAQHRVVGKLGLVSLDEGEYQHELTVGAASGVTIPQFDVATN
jgi:hypothetical protein